MAIVKDDGLQDVHYNLASVKSALTSKTHIIIQLEANSEILNQTHGNLSLRTTSSRVLICLCIVFLNRMLKSIGRDFSKVGIKVSYISWHETKQ